MMERPSGMELNHFDLCFFGPVRGDYLAGRFQSLPRDALQCDLNRGIGTHDVVEIPFLQLEEMGLVSRPHAGHSRFVENE